MLAAGTVVTGTGPLAGAGDVPRYHLPLEGVTQFHADIGWLLGGLTVAPARVGLRLTGAPARRVRLGWLVLGLIGAAGRHRLHPVLQRPAGRPGLGPRLRVGADLDRRPAADVRDAGPRPGDPAAAGKHRPGRPLRRPGGPAAAAR